MASSFHPSIIKLERKLSSVVLNPAISRSCNPLVFKPNHRRYPPEWPTKKSATIRPHAPISASESGRAASSLIFPVAIQCYRDWNTSSTSNASNIVIKKHSGATQKGAYPPSHSLPSVQHLRSRLRVLSLVYRRRRIHISTFCFIDNNDPSDGIDINLTNYLHPLHQLPRDTRHIYSGGVAILGIWLSKLDSGPRHHTNQPQINSISQIPLILKTGVLSAARHRPQGLSILALAMSTPYQAYNPNNPYIRTAPHVRLNSGRIEPAIDTYTDRPGPPRRDSSSRSLIPPGRPRTSPLRINAPAHGADIAPGPSTAEWNDSADRLLPPPATPRTHRSKGKESPGRSMASGRSSRRTSWSSSAEGSRSRNPFADSRAPSTTGSDEEEDLNTQTVSEKYNILPSAGLLLYPEDVEKDDYLHNPGPNDDKIDHNIFTKRGMANVGGLIVLSLGLLMLFIGFPVL